MVQSPANSPFMRTCNLLVLERLPMAYHSPAESVPAALGRITSSRSKAEINLKRLAKVLASGLDSRAEIVLGKRPTPAAASACVRRLVLRHPLSVSANCLVVRIGYSILSPSGYIE